MGHQMILKVVRYHSVPGGWSLVTLLTSIFLVRNLQVDVPEGPGWECQGGYVTRDWRFLGQTCREHGAIWGASSGLRRARLSGHCLQCQLLFLGEWRHCSGMRLIDSFWEYICTSKNPLLPRKWAPESLREGEWPHAPWTPSAMRSTSWWAGTYQGHRELLESP